MKKLTSLIVCLLTCLMAVSLAVSVVGCSSDDNEPQSYTITYDANGGTLSENTITVKKGDTITLPTPSKVGYTFEYWELDSNKFELSSYGFDKNITLVAKYTANTYTVSFDNGIEPLVVTYGATYTLPDATKEGHTFVKWLKNSEEFAKTGTWSLTENVELVAEFTANKYTVSFSDGVESYEVTFGTAYTLPTATKTGHTFVKWLRNGVEFTSSSSWALAENVELVAEFAPNSYNVSFDNGASPMVVTYGAPYTLQDASDISGYTFAGWKYGNEFIAKTGTWNIASDATLNAVYTANKYTVSFDNGIANREVTFGAEYELPIASKTGYTFGGWKNGNVVIESSGYWNIAGNVTLTPVFTAISYTVSLSVGNGQLQEGAQTSFKVDYDGNYDLTSYQVTAPQGYNFVGWYLTTDSDKKVIDVVGKWNFTDANPILVAKYVEKEMVNITINAGIGTLNGANTLQIENGTDYDLTSFVATPPTGYTFKAWSVAGNEINNSGKWDYGFGDVEVVAVYTANQYTISFSDGVPSMVVTYDEEYTLPTTATKEGYSFYRWLRNGAYFVKTDTWRITENIELVAEFTPNTYTVSFSDGVANKEVTFGATYTLPEAQAEAGYTFLKWQRDGVDFASSGTWNIAGNVSLTAVFTEAEYEIAISAGDGSLSAGSAGTITIKYNGEYDLSKIVVIPPTSANRNEPYVLEGWYVGETKIATKGVWTYTDANVIIVAKYVLRSMDENWHNPV